MEKARNGSDVCVCFEILLSSQSRIFRELLILDVLAFALNRK